MPLKERIIKVFTDKWQYKLAAFAAALILWFYVAKDQNLNIVVSVPIEFANFPESMELVNNDLTNTVKLTLSGRREIISRVHKGELRVIIDLKNAKQGENIYRINNDSIKFIPKGADVSDISPPQIDMVFVQENKK